MKTALGEKGRLVGNNVKSFIISLLSVVLILPTTALAVDADFTNETTGSDSVNTNELEQTTSVDISITNDADVDQVFDLTLNTGGNTITNNTEVGDVTTGDVVLDVEDVTEVNEGSLNLSDPDFLSLASGTITSENINTGSGSTNNNTTTIDDTFDLDITNTLAVTNDITLDIDTGNNTISDNTTVGDITTGDISVRLSFATFGNSAGGGFIPAIDEGGTAGSESVSDASSPLITAQATTENPIVGVGGGEFFPAGEADGIMMLFLFLLISIAAVRFSELPRAAVTRS